MWQKLQIQRISFKEAKEAMVKECNVQPQSWMNSAEWYVCLLDAEDFQKLLVFDGGRPMSGWQEFADGSYDIVNVAIGLRAYMGDREDLVKGREDVLMYERRIESGEYPEILCLVRTKGGERITLFETNHRAIALYLHYFVNAMRPYKPIKGILAEVLRKLPFQSQ